MVFHRKGLNKKHINAVIIYAICSSKV
uniref:Uncharacterized protein n=1 Tax=Rhizophora mucronata TaxID=61149 RepID=A0A2P2NUP6_RHIMU